MADNTILVRARYNDAAWQTMAREQSDRKSAFNSFCKAIGAELTSAYCSVTKGEAVMVVEGPPHLAAVISQVLYASGSFQYVETEHLLEATATIELLSESMKFANSYEPLSRDEIDRILLDE